MLDSIGNDVAPLAGSVDRNTRSAQKEVRPAASLPSRGAWIEISEMNSGILGILVAPLAGSVDRNHHHYLYRSTSGIRSLPSRGAWIEIIPEPVRDTRVQGRSPRGERG